MLAREAYRKSAVLLLVLTAVAKLYSAAGEARILALRDPLLPLTNRELLMAVGLIELAVAAYLVWGRSPVAKPLWVVWPIGHGAGSKEQGGKAFQRSEVRSQRSGR